MIRRKAVVVVVLIALASTGMSACGGGGGNSRTIEVDYRSDEFAGSFLGYYPRQVTVTPGMTLKFHQTWTGQPHSVTLGTVADEGFKVVEQVIRDYWAGKGLPDEPPPGYSEVFDEKLPSLFMTEKGLDQGAADPCYLDDEEDLPLGTAACKKAQQVQPEFNGRQAYYSSGFIPFEGVRGNTFEMKIADDAKEGTYFYYCNAHGAPMGGEITIDGDADVESQASINRRGKAEADREAKPVLAQLAKEKAGNGIYAGNLSGSGGVPELGAVQAFANEFTPRTIETNVGEPVKWTFIDDHTISFNVPAYTPIFKDDSKGRLDFNPEYQKPQKWPGAPERADFEGPPTERPAEEPANVDAGEFDGSGGLHSSGLGWADGDTYSVTFTKKGSFPYACLIHPGMIGKVVVK